MQHLETVRAKYLADIAAAGDEAAIEALRVAGLGKKGEISLMMRGLGKMTPVERQQAGPRLNALKDEINAAIAAFIALTCNNPVGGERRRQKSLRNCVHDACGVVWGAVYRTHLTGLGCCSASSPSSRRCSQTRARS